MRRSGTFAVAALLVAALPATSSDAPPDVAPRIAAVIAPLAHAPSVQTVAEPLDVELAATTSLEPGDEVHVELVPSFGEVRPVREVGSQRFESDDLGPSRLWPGRDALRFDYELPDDLAPGLYDLKARRGRPTIRSRRSVGRTSSDVRCRSSRSTPRRPASS